MREKSVKEKTVGGKSLLKEFFHYVASNVCGMIGLSCYILADTFFIADGLGADGLTALNLAIPIYSFVHGCGLMLGMGGATRYSVCRGQNAVQYADRAFTHTAGLMAVLAVVFMFCGVCFSEKITVWLGADADVFAMTKTYLQMILLFAPAFLANDTLLCFVRNDGAPRLAMAAMLTGSFSNILLDYIFIFPLRMGIFGAVLATGMAPLISLAVLSKYWIAGRNQFHLVRTAPSVRLTGSILSLGFPSFITEMASGIVMIVFNGIILSLQGNIGVAAYGVVANLSLVISSIYSGIAQGVQPLLSRAHGRGDGGSRKILLRYAVRTMLVLSGIIYLIMVLGADPIVGAFNSERNSQLQQIAAAGFALYFAAIPFAGFNIILSAYFSSIEQALAAQIISLARGFVILIPMAFLMSFFFQMTGVWLSLPFTECLVTLAGVYFLMRLE